MPLTPEDVSNKRFTAVRLREGYDMGEVDQFLDEVEAELTRLTKENDELRSKLDAAGGEAPVQQQAPPQAQQQAQQQAQKQAQPEKEPEPEPEPEKEPESEQEPQKPAGESPGGVETIQVTTTEEASRAATRLLEMAGRNADELLAEAEQQRDELLSDARAEAERLEQERKSNVERVEAEAAERRQQLMGDMDAERERLAAEVARLEEFEKTYRQELRDYFQQQLTSLEGDGTRAGPEELSGSPSGSEDTSSQS